MARHANYSRLRSDVKVFRTTTHQHGTLRIYRQPPSGFSCDVCGLSLECFGSRSALKRHEAECSG